jgi:aminoglycoside phosphotransferase (APT) family kinase protein
VSRVFEGIPGSEEWTSIEPIAKGWSKDTKYRVETSCGEQLLVRISDIAEYPRKKLEFEALRELEALPILMTRPMDFGTFNDGVGDADYPDGAYSADDADGADDIPCTRVFTITTWIDGVDAESVLPELSAKEQYDLGYAAGRILWQIHRIPAPPEQPDWAERFNRKIDRNIRNYQACGIEVPGADQAIEHINSLRHLLKGRPQVFQHGDYHCGNMIVTDDRQIGIIDFNRLDYGDPWEEFNRVVWCAAVSGYFASGRINGYFAGLEGHACDHVPDVFFRLMSLYIANNMLSSVPWAIQFGQGEVDTMFNQARNVLDWYNGFRSYIPRWYRKGSPWS